MATIDKTTSGIIDLPKMVECQKTKINILCNIRINKKHERKCFQLPLEYLRNYQEGENDPFKNGKTEKVYKNHENFI